MTQELLDFRPGMDMTWEIRRTEPRFETTFWMEPTTAKPPLHLHPHAEERYEVLEGSIQVNVDGEWHTVRSGEDLTVPPGVPHTLRPDPDTDEGATLINSHDPSMRYESFFREFHRLASEGKVSFPPTRPRALLRVAMWLSAYPEEIRGVRPPQWFFDALAKLGRRLGLGREATTT